MQKLNLERFLNFHQIGLRNFFLPAFQFLWFMTMFPCSGLLENLYAYFLKQYMDIFLLVFEVSNFVFEFHPFWIQNTWKQFNRCSTLNDEIFVFGYSTILSGTGLQKFSRHSTITKKIYFVSKLPTIHIMSTCIIILIINVLYIYEIKFEFL